jgi:hypothetical protein
MTATATDIRDAFLTEVPTHIHQDARDCCHDLIYEMHHAARAGDNAELARLLQRVRSIIDDELHHR